MEEKGNSGKKGRQIKNGRTYNVLPSFSLNY